MISIEPLGTNGRLLRAIAIGYELQDKVASMGFDAIRRLPSDGSILCIDQQAGGYSMFYPVVVGALLRLETNDGKGKRPFGDLVRGFHAMAEDPDLNVLRDYSILRSLVCTRGDPYIGDELKSLQQFLEEYFSVPEILGGYEAFIRFAPCDPLAYFEGWNILKCRVATGREDASPYARYSEDNLADLVCEENSPMNTTLLRSIVEIGGALGCNSEPSAFLMWENSD
jgi:hypothetical protein